MLVQSPQTGQGPTVVVPPGTVQDNYLHDIFTWTGTQNIAGTAPGVYFNLASLAALTKTAGGTAGTSIASNAILFPAIAKKTGVVFTVRITGTITGGLGLAREWYTQTRRTDGTTIVGSECDVKIGLIANDISNRDTSLVTFTDGVTDPFSVTGIQLGIFNDSGQTITITALRILVQRIVNQT